MSIHGERGGGVTSIVKEYADVQLEWVFFHSISIGGFRGGRRGRSPPPPKIVPKKRKSSYFVIFPYLVVKMQNFLGSLRSPALFNIIINITLLKNLQNNTCSYILSSFYLAATIATGEGKFDIKIQVFWTLKSLHCMSFRGGGGLRPLFPPPELRPGPDWGPRRSPDPSPNFAAPSNSKTWIRA